MLYTVLLHVLQILEEYKDEMSLYSFLFYLHAWPPTVKFTDCPRVLSGLEIAFKWRRTSGGCGLRNKVGPCPWQLVSSPRLGLGVSQHPPRVSSCVKKKVLQPHSSSGWQEETLQLGWPPQVLCYWISKNWAKQKTWPFEDATSFWVSAIHTTNL